MSMLQEISSLRESGEPGREFLCDGKELGGIRV